MKMKESKKIIPYCDYNSQIPPSEQWDYIGTVTPTFSRNGLRNGWKIIEIETNMADQNAIELPSELKGKKFRIRKLTPRECFRLMGVDDKDIDKIQAAGVSNSGQHKLAGNSIVAGGNYVDYNGNVDGVLYNIFRKMFVQIEPDATKGEVTQLTLF